MKGEKMLSVSNVSNGTKKPIIIEEEDEKRASLARKNKIKLERTPSADLFTYSDYVKDTLNSEPQNIFDIMHKQNVLFNPFYGVTMYQMDNFAKAADKVIYKDK